MGAFCVCPGLRMCEDMNQEKQVEIYDETSRTWLVFDDDADAEEYGLSGDGDLIADVVPLTGPEPDLDVT